MAKYCVFASMLGIKNITPGKDAQIPTSRACCTDLARRRRMATLRQEMIRWLTEINTRSVTESR